MDDEVTDLKTALAEIEADLRDLKRHRGSRYVGPGADPDYAAHIAAGGTSADYKGDRRLDSKRVARPVEPGREGSGGSLVKSIIAIRDHQTDHLRPVWSEKALAEATDSAGGFLLEPEIASDVMMLLRNRAAVLKLPISTVKPRSKRFDMPGLSAGASASWLPENSVLPAGMQTFEVAAQLYPKAIGGLVAISNRLLADATADNPWSADSVEQVVERDISDLLATTVDNGFINGGSNAPTGILNTSGTTPLAGFTIPTNGFSITTGTNTYGLLVAIVNTLREANVPLNSGAWLFAPRTLQGLETLTNSYGEPLLSSAGLLTINPKDGTSGTLMGFPFQVTNNVPTNMTYGSANNASAIVFGAWEEAYYGDWQELALDSSGEASYTPDGVSWVSAYQSMQTVVRCTMWCDFEIRRTAAFVVVKGILP